MPQNYYKFIIIGAGLSGLSSAFELCKKYPNQVLILEKDRQVGGLAKTIQKNDCRYDLGSHRIHYNPREKAFNLIKELCEGLILKKVRRGKLRLKNSYINYPISSFQMFRGIGLFESAMCAVSLVRYRVLNKIINGHKKDEEYNYETYLIQRAGYRAYKLFYEPYARKVWGCNPSIISTTAVKKRVSMSSPTMFINNIINSYKGDHSEQFYYYIKGGIGILAQRLRDRVSKMGCEIIKGVTDFTFSNDQQKKNLTFIVSGDKYQVTYQKIISTIPINEIVEKVNPPANVKEACSKITWRTLRLIYLHIRGKPKMEGETFYFPEAKYIFGRVSIPKRYDSSMQPNCDFTSFICEVPCNERDGVFNTRDKELFDACYEGLKQAGIIFGNQENIYKRNFIVNVPNVYPVYIFGWESIMKILTNYISSKHPSIYISGKLGFFLHCNLDHAIEIGLLAAESVMKGQTSREWNNRLDEFHSMKLRD